MKLRAIVNAVIIGITTGIKSILAYNHVIKAIDRKAYDISIKQTIERERGYK